MTVPVTLGGRLRHVLLRNAADGAPTPVAIDGVERLVDSAWVDAETLSLILWEGGAAHVREVGVRRRGRPGGAGVELEVSIDGRSWTALAGGGRGGWWASRPGTVQRGRRLVSSPMPGRVVRVLTAVGAQVAAGEPLVVIEAMKMENELRAPGSGVVREMNAVEGAAVEGGAVLVVIE